MKVKSVLVSQPRPAVIEKSPFYELSQKYHVEIAYKPFIRVVGVSLKEFRAQRVEILSHTAVIFTSRTTVDSFFHICEEARITVPETMKYICQTEAVALYLQKYIVYRKRKISFADGSFTSLVELIIKHKEEKLLLALSEPHRPELPETLAKLKLSVSPVILARTVAGDLDDVKLDDYGLLALYSSRNSAPTTCRPSRYSAKARCGPPSVPESPCWPTPRRRKPPRWSRPSTSSCKKCRKAKNRPPSNW